MRGYWLYGTTERKLINHRKFKTGTARPGIFIFFLSSNANNYHKNFDTRIPFRKRNGTAVFTKRLGNVFDEDESQTYLPAHFLTYSELKTNNLFPLKNNSTTEINDLAERKNDSAAATNDFAGQKNDFAELKNDFADYVKASFSLKNEVFQVKSNSVTGKCGMGEYFN